MKKLLIALMSCMLVFAVAAPTIVDAKPGKSYKSPAGGFTKPTAPKDNVSKTQPSNQAKSPATGTTTPNRGFFGGGSFLGGMMTGLFAGMLFGGLFGSMGGFGNIMGLLVNVLVIYALFAAIRGIVRYFANKRRPRPYDRRY